MPRAVKDSKSAKPAQKATSQKATPAKKAAAPAKKATKVEEAAPVETENAVAQENTINTDFVKLLAHIQQVSATLTAIKTEVRQLEKRATREVKEAKKASGKRARPSSGNRQPSGFVKPTKISDTLASFLGKPKGTEMARTEVTKEINAYIRAHKLQDPSNGRIIKADNKLSTLLNLKKDEELTYFNLQKFMSPHFAKATATATA